MGRMKHDSVHRGNGGRMLKRAAWLLAGTVWSRKDCRSDPCGRLCPFRMPDPSVACCRNGRTDGGHSCDRHPVRRHRVGRIDVLEMREHDGMVGRVLLPPDASSNAASAARRTMIGLPLQTQHILWRRLETSTCCRCPPTLTTQKQCRCIPHCRREARTRSSNGNPSVLSVHRHPKRTGAVSSGRALPTR